MAERLKVVIGAGRYPEGAAEIGMRGGNEDSKVQAQVLTASILRHSPDTVIINTYGMDKPRMKKHKNPTPFSLVRFMAPKLVDYEGWVLYCDADQVVFRDVQMLIDVKNDDLSERAVYIAKEVRCTGVVLMDASRLTNWDAWEVAARVDSGASQYGRMMRDLNGVGFGSMGDLGNGWNSHDRWNESTKLLHFTNLSTQPWKVPGKHQLEHIWAEQLRRAIEEEFVSDDDLDANCHQILETQKASAT